MSYINAGSRAGVFTVLGTPRAKTTEVAEGSSSRTTPSGSSRSIRIVAWAAIRVAPLEKSSRPSWRKRESGILVQALLDFLRVLCRYCRSGTSGRCGRCRRRFHGRRDAALHRVRLQRCGSRSTLPLRQYSRPHECDADADDNGPPALSKPFIRSSHDVASWFDAERVRGPSTPSGLIPQKRP